MKTIFKPLKITTDQPYWHEGKPFDGIVVYRREHSTTESEVVLEDGIQSGPFSGFHPNGQLACKGAIKNNVNHGDFKYWDSDGLPKKPERYKFGIFTSKQEYD